MNPVLRTIAIYFFFFFLFRIAGRRTLGEMTNFDFVLVLVSAEVTGNMFLGDEDSSLTGCFVVVSTLIGVDILLTMLKQRFRRLEKWMDGVPLVLVENGKPLKDLMHRARVDEHDILAAARENQGLERMDQIKYAVLETNGSISIVRA